MREPESLETAYGRLADRIRRIAYRKLGDCHEAEDISQEVILAAFRSSKSLRDPARIEGWLVRITRNVASTAARKARRCRPDSRLSTGLDPEEMGDTHSPWEALRSAEPSAESVISLRSALADAPAAWRDAFDACVLQGQELREFAAARGVSVACVKTRISRVRRRLRDAL